MGSKKMDIDIGHKISETDDLEENHQMDAVEASECGLKTSSSALSKYDLSKEELHKFLKDATVSFFNEWGLISHQLNSFNEFVDHGIHKLFDSLGEFQVSPDYNPSRKTFGGWRSAVVKFGNVRIDKPSFCDEQGNTWPLTPSQARLQNLSYSSRIHAEINVQVFEDVKKNEKFKTGKEPYRNAVTEKTCDVLIGRVPVMVKSSLCCLEKEDCDFDLGGYFIIKGSEKTFIAQERRCLRRLWVSDKPTWMISYIPDEIKRRRIYIKLLGTSKGALAEVKIINVIFLYAAVPVWIMFFALGATSDKEIVDMLDLDTSDGSFSNIILSAIYDADEKCEDFRRSGRAMDYINGLIRKSKFPPSESMDECIDLYLFPALQSRRMKALFLGYMVKCLLLSYFGQRKIDNKDDFRNKRLELAGELLERELLLHVRNAGRRMIRALQRDLSKDLKSIDNYFDASIVTNGLHRAFSTGGWSHSYKRNERCSGVVATLRRTNPLQTVSDMRKSRLQVQYTGKIGDARYPNPSYWGKVCFLSTPDGENCGLVKNLAVTGLVSTSLLDVPLDKLVDCGMEDIDDSSLSSLHGRFKIFLNGEWVGLCEDSITFVSNLKNLRRSLIINPQVEIKRDEQLMEIRIFSDPGRIMRPLLIVENNELAVSKEKIEKFRSKNYSFSCLLEEKMIEFIGVEEEEDCRTAWGFAYLLDHKGQPAHYTHCELDLSFLLALSCGIIPFANHNFARRVLYQSEKHSQQAIGFWTTNPNVRVDTLSHQLYYPQKPLFRTMISDCIGKSEHFNGQNAIVAVNVHMGYNQEDSLVLNQTSLQRGMYRTEHYRSYKSEIDVVKVTGKRFKVKEKVDFGKPLTGYGRVDSLEDDGFPFIGANLQAGDVVIGRVAESGEDHSVKLKHTEKGKVQRVLLSANDEGKNFAVVSLRQVRSPCLGDKFSSMHGQKGVVGFLDSQENFPFTREGIVPDIVINPHAFPTRQTPGQLLECALGKGIASGGRMKYATPYAAASFDDITEQLHSLGYSRWGNERVYNGRTGQRLKSLIFMGPTFYQRLIHMSEDKVKFRNTGPVHPLTRQPVSDRKRYGGVKFGEMERDCLLAHGAASNLQERLFLLSDFSHMMICQKCSRVANVVLRSTTDRKVRGPYCSFCKSIEHIVKINVPYGAKLLYQELFSMGICLKFKTELC
ncbi:DNA-directed RNA polymerases IV and V subunit 2-like [Nymphaea colorata]|nr:DNA-directed RNA polymerases IV and V subunit 2-like [Nymphaea colorata]XP_031475778.1 DNA-directed RNA polymerases IV and V subunit 2-like [Nymphaea colorata]XP_031475780.1 DNA-directed RNA polymerases IV and V subunit 2-like [Nymphaea colorata]